MPPAPHPLWPLSMDPLGQEAPAQKGPFPTQKHLLGAGPLTCGEEGKAGVSWDRAARARVNAMEARRVVGREMEMEMESLIGAD